MIVTELRTRYPPNMAPWNTEYFKLKEFEKWQVWEGVSDLPFSLEEGQKTLLWDVISLFPEKRRDTEKNLNKQAFAKFPPVCYTCLTLFDWSSFYTTVHSLLPSIHILRFNCSFRYSFLHEDSLPLKHREYICMLFSC